MAFGAKGKGRPRNPNQQNALFKRKKFCRFTVDHVDQIDYKDIDTLRSLPCSSCLHRQSVIGGNQHANHSA